MKRLLVVLCALLLVFVVDVCAQQSLTDEGLGTVVFPAIRDFHGGGARALGMSGAFLGLSDDVTGLSWNPAGVYSQDQTYEQPIISLGWGSYNGDNTFSLDGIQRPQSNDLSKSFDGITLFSMIAPVRVKGHPFVGGFTYHRLDDELAAAAFRYDTTTYYTIQDIEQDTPRPFSRLFGTEYHSKINSLDFGFGTRLYDRLSMGFVIGVYTGKGWYNERYTQVQDGVPDVLGYQRVLQINDSLVIDSITYSGVSFTLGFRYAADKWSAGMIIRAPHKLKQELDRTVILAQTINGNTTDAGSIKRHDDNHLIEIDQPLVIGGGVAYKVTEKLLWAADLEYRAYSGGEVRVRDSLKLNPGDKDTEYFSTYDPHWNNVIAMRTGGEYMLETGSHIAPIIPIRAGVGYTQIPAPGIDQSFSLTTPSKFSYSFGAGVRWGLVHFDFAYVGWSWDTERTTPAVIEGVSSNTYETSKNTDHSFNFSFTGFF